MLTLTAINGIAYGNLLFLMAAGLTLIFGVLRVINMAHGSFYLLGAHVTISTAQGGGGIVLAALAGGMTAAVLGAAAERTLLNRLQDNYLAQVLVTIGIYLIIGDLALLTWGGTPRVLTLPAELSMSVTLGSLRYPVDRLALIILSPVIALFLWAVIERTRIGASIRAAVDDEEIAKAIGISVPRLRLIVFAGGSFLAGLSGALGSTFIGAKPGIDLEVMLLALVIVIVGGPGSLVGSYVAAILIGVLDSFGKTFWPEASLFLLFAPMLLVLLVRPQGLFGRISTGTSPKPRARPLVLPVPQVVLSLFDWTIRKFRSLRYVAPSALLLAGILGPFLLSNYTLGVLTLALSWSLFAVGLNVMLGFGGMPSLGHAIFFGIGAYVVAWSYFAGLSGILGLAAASLAGAFASLILATVSLRSRQAQFLLVTLAFAQVVWGVVFKWRSVTNGDDGLILAQSVPVMPGVSYAAGLYISVGCICAIAFLVYFVFVSSRFGLTVQAMRSNEARLLSLGYNATVYRLGAYILSGAISGLAGGLFAIYSGFVAPDLFSVNASAKVLLMVIIGGAGTILGPIWGAIAIVGLEEILSGLTERWHSVLGLIYICVALLIFAGIRLRPFQRPLRPSLSEQGIVTR